jgi:REP-associated tyrosine transposase
MPKSLPNRKTCRLQDYDYTSPGAYFITICTWKKKCLLGKIEDGRMRLNEIGLLASQYWWEIPKHFPNVQLDAFIVMPNHIHGILIFGEYISDTAPAPLARIHLRALPCVPTAKPFGKLISRTDKGLKANAGEQFGKPVSGSLPSVLRSFKASVTKRVNILRNTPGDRLWQSRYYEHVIRKPEKINLMREYINSNPARWAIDRENPDTRDKPDRK